MRLCLLRAGSAGRWKNLATPVSRVALASSVALAAMFLSNTEVQAFLFFGNDRPPAYLTQRPPLPPSAGPTAPGTGEPRRKRPLPQVRARLMSPQEKVKFADFLAAAKKGPLLAAVSLNDQHVTLYADGVEIARAPISSGTAGHPTPTGIFSIIQKNLFHRSNIYSNAPMPYMQRITWSGVALHQGVLPGYPASHGCIRLPDLFARQLWTVTKLGVRVVVTRDPVKPVEFAHAGLPKLPAKADDKTPQANATPTAPIKVAQGGATASDAAPVASSAEPVAVPAAVPIEEDGAHSVGFSMDPRTLRPAPITIFVSRKEGRVFVRKGFDPLFDAPVTIAEPEKPVGTHLFTAMGASEDGSLRWTAVSMPSYREEGAGPVRHKPRNKRHNRAAAPASEVSAASQVLNPSEALDRVSIDPVTLGHITRLMSAGASFIISDQGLGRETGRETDFVIVTR